MSSWSDSHSWLGKIVPKNLSNFPDEFNSFAIFLSGDVQGIVDGDGQILSHETALHCLDDRCFESVAEMGQLVIVVQLCPVEESSSPCVNAGDGVC